MTNIAQAKIDTYREYFNDFLTVDRFAEYREQHPIKTRKLLAQGRALDRSRFGYVIEGRRYAQGDQS